jgi:hypothetical protein
MIVKAPAPPEYSFDNDLRLEPKGESTFEGMITANWSVNGDPNGGYLMAFMAKAMRELSDKKRPVIVTANYLAKGETCLSEVVVEPISTGKQLNRLQARLMQNGVEKTRCWGTFIGENDYADINSYEKEPPLLPSREDCYPFPALPKYTLFSSMNILLDPSCAGWIKREGKLAEISEHRGWIKFKDNRPCDHLSLLLMADAFPPPVLAKHGSLKWVPTIEYSVNVRAIADTPWIKAVFRSYFVTRGIVEEDGELWDENGKLLVVSRQIAQFRKK